MRTKRAYLPQRAVSGESGLMLIGCKAIQNACCNGKKTAYNGADVLNEYLNPSAQGTKETLVEFIGEPRTISSFPISENNKHRPQLRSNILAPLLASGSKSPSTYDYIWRDMYVLPSMLVIKNGTRRNVSCSLI